jgi:hypothetical protein
MDPLADLRTVNQSNSSTRSDPLANLRAVNARNTPEQLNMAYARSQEYRNAEMLRRAEDARMKSFHGRLGSLKDYVTHTGPSNFITAFSEGMMQTPVDEKTWNPITMAQRGSARFLDTYTHAIEDMADRLNKFVDVTSGGKSFEEQFGIGAKNPWESGEPAKGILSGNNEQSIKNLAATGELALGALNVALAPVMSGMTSLSPIPGIGHVADGINSVMFGIFSGTGQIASDALWANPYMSDKNKQELDQLVRETAGLLGILKVGKTFAPKEKPSEYEAYLRPDEMEVIDFGETPPPRPPKAGEDVTVVPERIARVPEDPNLPIIDYDAAVAKTKENIIEITERAKNDPVAREEVAKSDAESLDASLGYERAVMGTNRYKQENQKYADFERAESEALIEIQIAEPGRRNFAEDGTVTGQRSTYPEWIPENARNRQTLDRVVEYYEAGTEPRGNATNIKDGLDALVARIAETVDKSKPAAEVAVVDTMPTGSSAMGVTPKTARAEGGGAEQGGQVSPSTDLLQPLSGTGERVIPQQSERIARIASSIDPSLGEFFLGNSRKRLNMRIQTESAARFAVLAPERSIRVAKGYEAPPKAGEVGPEPLTQNIVKEAVMQKAILDGNLDLVMELAGRGTPLYGALSRHAQELLSARGTDVYSSPTALADMVRQAKMEVYGKKFNKNPEQAKEVAEQAVREKTKKLEEVAERDIVSQQRLDEYLRNLECK